MTISRRGLMLGAAAAVAGCQRREPPPTVINEPAGPPWSPPEVLPDPATAPALKDHFAGRFTFGMAAEPYMLDSPVTRPLLLKHAASLTAENVMKPDVLAPAEGRYDFARADALVAFAAANGMAVQGTTLVWHMATPAWFFAGDAKAVRARLERYVTDVVSHFRGKVAAWVVVNEPTSNLSGGTYRDSPWYKALGPDYIDIAFRAARAADPGAHLILNEYLTEAPAKRARFMTIVDGLKARGVPLDGLGHQLHLEVAPKVWDGPLSFTAADVAAALADTEKRGLASHVTELDMSVYKDPAGCFATGEGCEAELSDQALAFALKLQALHYHDLFTVLRAHRSLKSVTTWGVADNRSWLNDYPAKRRNHPLLFDRQGLPKPAFWGVIDP